MPEDTPFQRNPQEVESRNQCQVYRWGWKAGSKQTDDRESGYFEQVHPLLLGVS